MLGVSFETVHNVLRLNFSGRFTMADLDAIDPTLKRFLNQKSCSGIRTLYDMTGVEALEVAPARFAERARLPPIGNSMRIVVAPPWAGPDFGRSYRHAQASCAHPQPVIVQTLPDAYRLLELADPNFQPLGHSSANVVQRAHRESSPRCFVRISQRGPSAEPYGWEIYREVDSVEIHRSKRTFGTRIEAILDSARTAAELALGPIIELSRDGAPQGYWPH